MNIKTISENKKDKRARYNVKCVNCGKLIDKKSADKSVKEYGFVMHIPSCQMFSLLRDKSNTGKILLSIIKNGNLTIDDHISIKISILKTNIKNILKHYEIRN